MRLLSVISIILILLSYAPAEKFAGEFLYLGAGGRALAMGGAYTAAGGDLFSAYYNPAGLIGIEGKQAAFMHSETFGSLLNHDILIAARKYDNAVMAVSLYRLGGGGIYVTEEYNGRFRIVSEESHADYVGGFSYARQQGEKLNWGLTAKMIYRDIINYSAWGLGLDAGMTYAFKDYLTAGLAIQDMTGTVLSYSYDNKETINPTMKLGVKLNHDVGLFTGTILADTDLRFEGRQATAQFYQSWISADTHLGFEVEYNDVVAARIGSDIGYLTTGVGLKLSRYVIDFALFDHSDLDTSYRGSLIVNW